MTTSDPETATLQAAPPAAEPKATTKAHTAPRKPRVAPAKGRTDKKTTQAKKGAKKPKGAKGAKPAEKEPGPRESSKAAKVLELLKRPDGATLKELMKVTGWQPHSVRGYLSGTVGKKLGLKVESTKAENGERSYSVKA